MDSGQISVIVPHHGDAAPTLSLLDQLRHQVTQREMQLIVVDDASATPFPLVDGVEVVRRDVNGGFAAAVNSGLAQAADDYLLVLNSDVSVAPDFIERLLAGAQPYWPVVATCRVRESFGERCMGHTWPTARAVFLEQLVPLARFHGQRWYEHQTNNLIESIGTTEPMFVDWVTGICLLMPTADVRLVGGLDERYFMNCEEVDLQRRLRDERNLKAIVLPEPVIDHVGGGSSPSPKRSGWVLDARLRYYEKWVGGAALKNSLKVAAYTNLGWNKMRARLGRQVSADDDFQREITTLQHAWETRR